MNALTRFAQFIAIAGVLFATAAFTARADSFDVSLNTTSLSGPQVLALDSP